MRLTRAGEYAVRCVLYLAGQEKGAVVKRREIAKAMEIPYEFLGKVSQILSVSGIIRIVQGAKGGYILLSKPEDLTLLDVIEAVEGEIFLNDCVLHPGSCDLNQTCPIHPVWVESREALRKTLASANFAALAENGKALSKKAMKAAG